MKILVKRTKQYLYILMGMIITVAIGTFLYGAYIILTTIHQPHSLEFTYLQNVRREPPTFHLNENVPVEALFYDKDNAPITFQAIVFWRMVTPPTNHNVLQLAFSRTINPGCTELSFNNLAPEQVKRFTNEQFENGITEVVWRIEGSNAVTHPYAGGLQPFQVELFKYVPTSQPIPNHHDEDKLKC